MPKKIFVIDDDISHSEQLAITLKDNGYGIIIHHSADNTFHLLNVEKPDLVLLDFFNPNTTEISAFLNQHTIPFVLICNGDEKISISDAYKQGALNVLLKPINDRQLIIEIETALHWQWERMQLNRRKENIDNTIKNNRKISVAIGIVMERYKIKGPESFEIMRNTARSKQHRIIDIAEKIIDAHEKSVQTLSSEPLLHAQQNPQNHQTVINQILDELLL